MSGVKLEEITITLDAFKASHPTSFAPTLPALEVVDGTFLTSSIAIAQYIAQIGAKPDLMGKSPIERAQVDQWITVLRGELQPITRMVCYQTYGQVPVD